MALAQGTLHGTRFAKQIVAPDARTVCARGKCAPARFAMKYLAFQKSSAGECNEPNAGQRTLGRRTASGIMTQTVSWLSASRKIYKMFVKLPHGQHIKLDLAAVGQMQAEWMQP